jgi:hypothetical protein
MKITTNNSFLFLIDVRHYIIYIMISEAAEDENHNEQLFFIFDRC